MRRGSKSGEFEVQPARVYPIDRPELTGRVQDNVKGWAVGRFGADVSRINDRNEIVEHRVRGVDALKVGDRIVAPTLMGDVQAVVGRDDVGDLCWISGGFVGDLEYDSKGDSWTTSIAISKKLLR